MKDIILKFLDDEAGKFLFYVLIILALVGFYGVTEMYIKTITLTNEQEIRLQKLEKKVFGSKKETR